MFARATMTGAFFIAAASPAFAADPAANFLANLFINACLPNLGQPAKVQQWAEGHHLGKIENAGALGVFVGPGGKGAAWAVPAAEGKFVLSIRGTTQACAVWAQAANPVDVKNDFQKIIEGVKRPGINASIDKDTVAPRPVGEVRALVYNVAVPNAPASLEFTLLTAERSGGAFQASMQAAKAGAH